MSDQETSASGMTPKALAAEAYRLMREENCSTTAVGEILRARGCNEEEIKRALKAVLRMDRIERSAREEMRASGGVKGAGPGALLLMVGAILLLVFRLLVVSRATSAEGALAATPLYCIALGMMGLGAVVMVFAYRRNLVERH